jgi:hypothetical protein
MARTCYDHLAGRLGVAVTDAGIEFFRHFGIDLDDLMTGSGTARLGSCADPASIGANDAVTLPAGSGQPYARTVLPRDGYAASMHTRRHDRAEGAAEGNRCSGSVSPVAPFAPTELDAASLLLRSETRDHFEHDKNDPCGEERHNAPIENRVHRVDVFGTAATIEFLSSPLHPLNWFCAISTSIGSLKKDAGWKSSSS